MNPYDFVPAAVKKREKKTPAGHNVFSDRTGWIKCTLRTETPLFIAKGEDKEILRNGHKKKEFITCKGKPTIPGSSLKGMLRSVAEAVADSCMVLVDGKYRHLRHEDKEINYDISQFAPCSSPDKLCITCRIFGMSSEKRGVFRGKVGISDGVIANEDYKILDWQVLPELSSPKPQHRPFYEKDGVVRGRKFYYHQNRPQSTLDRTKRNISVRPLENGSFVFNVSFQNVEDEELALLLYSLVLEPKMRHKLGMGKPVGLGSVKIEIEEITIYDQEKSYLKLEVEKKIYREMELFTFIESQTKEFRRSREPNLAVLRRIWQWPPLKHDFKYPGFNWFRENPEMPLEEYQR